MLHRLDKVQETQGSREDNRGIPTEADHASAKAKGAPKLGDRLDGYYCFGSSRHGGARALVGRILVSATIIHLGGEGVNRLISRSPRRPGL